jgi:hypothetical protein
VQKRSSLVDAKLTKEGLAGALTCVWNGYFMVFVNGNVYVADSRQKTYTNNSTGTFEYEWYFWNSADVDGTNDFKKITALCSGDGLYFGTSDGKVFEFYTNTADIKSYNDNGQAIAAEWATPLETDGDFMLYKTMVKKGSGVFLKTFNRSSVKISVRTEKDFGTLVKTANLGLFNFADMDFAHFTFNTSGQYIVPVNSKVKKYKCIQIICRNDELNEGFGVYSIIRRYTVGNYVKE